MENPQHNLFYKRSCHRLLLGSLLRVSPCHAAKKPDTLLFRVKVRRYFSLTLRGTISACFSLLETKLAFYIFANSSLQKGLRIKKEDNKYFSELFVSGRLN